MDNLGTQEIANVGITARGYSYVTAILDVYLLGTGSLSMKIDLGRSVLQTDIPSLDSSTVYV